MTTAGSEPPFIIIRKLTARKPMARHRTPYGWWMLFVRLTALFVWGAWMVVAVLLLVVVLGGLR